MILIVTHLIAVHLLLTYISYYCLSLDSAVTKHIVANTNANRVNNIIVIVFVTLAHVMIGVLYKNKKKSSSIFKLKKMFYCIDYVLDYLYH